MGRVLGWVWGPGGCTGVGNTGVYYPATQHAARGATQRSGPRKPLQGAGVGGVADVPGTAAGRLLRPPYGPGRSLQALPVSGPSECRLWANTATFDLILLKLSQNRRVSPFLIEKACHSPYFQNGLQKSALEKLRFPFSRAFSHKELMGLF